MKDLLEASIGLATSAAMGKADKLGRPSILHPIRVLGALSKIERDPITLSAAILHDTLEDSPELVTPEKMLDLGFPVALVNVVWMLTHHKGYSYTSYIQQVISDKRAAKVKLFDVTDNKSRVHELSGELERTRLYEKYDKAFRLLNVIVHATDFEEARKHSFEFVYGVPFIERRHTFFRI